MMPANWSWLPDGLARRAPFFVGISTTPLALARAIEAETHFLAWVVALTSWLALPAALGLIVASISRSVICVAAATVTAFTLTMWTAPNFISTPPWTTG